MIEPWKIIEELESDNSRLFKEGVIEKHLNDKTFQEGLVMCLDPLTTFGVKQVPECIEDGVGLDWSDFKKAANQLIDREKTGHAARDLIIELIESSKTDQWNDWYRRILIKDLRCGVSEKTVNNVAKKMDLEFRVPIFSCMLANIHEKIGTLNSKSIFFATLFTVFSLTPHLRSLMRILLYQSFH